jgi:hypothetical protein
MSSSGELSARQERALTCLLAAPSITEAAQQAEIGESTLRMWLRNDAFLAAYRAARRQVVEATIARLQQLTSEAAEALQRGMASTNTNASIKAACAVLDYAFRGAELIDLAERLEKLERALKGEGDGVPEGTADPAGERGPESPAE